MDTTDKAKYEKILDRIRSLRNLAHKNPEKKEAEAAASAAAKYMAEFQISEAELVSRGEAVAEGIELNEDHCIYETGRSTPWKAELAWGISKLNGLFCLKYQIRHSGTHRQGSRYRVFGRKSDIAIALYMFEYLVSTIQALVDAEYPAGNFGVDDEGRLVKKRGVNPLKESWALGCVRGFLAKMNTERDAVLRTGSSAAMVLVTNKADEAREAYIKANTKPVDPDAAPKRGRKKALFGKVAASKAQSDYDAMSKGYVKGQTLTVARGLGEGNNE